MSPASNRHGQIQGRLSGLLWNTQQGGEIITECSIQTADGVKVADVAWASDQFIAEFGYATPYPKAPELCIEIVSPSNSQTELSEKVQLYLGKGAQEVWIVYENGEFEIFTYTGKIPLSKLAPNAQKNL
jgi:Uma2 family endonuclease